jgi:hypothetical protein
MDSLDTFSVCVIAFGFIELVVLCAYLIFGDRKPL